jgi:DNA-binding transcriptional LysR family regulator
MVIIVSYFEHIMDRVTAAKVFVDIAHSGSFTATADRLGMSRPMVTRYLEAMESWFDARLLHRTTRKVTLTTQGQHCLLEVEQWLEAADQLISKIKPSDELSGSIKITSSLSFTHAQLIKPISDFLALHPKVIINIDLQDKAEDLIKNQVDLAIRIASNPDSALIGKPITVCKSVLVASRSYLKNHPDILQPEDLSNHNCLTHSSFDHQIWHLHKNNQHKSIQIHSTLTANDSSTLLEASIFGAGISMQPTFLANHALQHNTLEQVLPDWGLIEMNIYALYSSRKHLSPTVRALIDFLTTYYKSHHWD